MLRAVLDNPSDDTNFTLLYAARAPEDLLLRKELDAWAEQHEQFEVSSSKACACARAWLACRGPIQCAL